MKGLLLLTVLFIGDTWSIEDVDGVKSHCPNTKECIHASSIFQDWNQILPKIKMTRAEYACNDCSKLCCLIKGCDAWVLNQRDNICLIGTVGSQRQLKYDQVFKVSVSILLLTYLISNRFCRILFLVQWNVTTM